ETVALENGGGLGAPDDHREGLDVDLVNQGRPEEYAVESAARVRDAAIHAEHLAQAVDRPAQIDTILADFEIGHALLAEEPATGGGRRPRHQNGQSCAIHLGSGPPHPRAAVDHDVPPAGMSAQ